MVQPRVQTDLYDKIISAARTLDRRADFRSLLSDGDAVYGTIFAPSFKKGEEEEEKLRTAVLGRLSKSELSKIPFLYLRSPGDDPF